MTMIELHRYLVQLFYRPTSNKLVPVQVTAVGCVMNGMTNLEQIPPKAMEGLTADIVSCLNPTVLQVELLHYIQTCNNKNKIGRFRTFPLRW